MSEQTFAQANLPVLALYRTMRTIRRFEEVAIQLLLERKIPSSLHTSIGQEAVAAGVCCALSSDDLIYSNHRGHGHCIAKGIELRAMMAELLGKSGGANSGRSGSMHVSDPAQGVMGTNGIVGGGLSLAAGAAYACQVLGERRVTVCFFGEGAASEGIAHEAMNIAALWKLPVVFVCENNCYAEMTPWDVHSPVAELSARAAGYGFPGKTVDGNDAIAVYEASGAAVERARSGAGPSLLECKTYRVRGHYEGDPQRYRPQDEAAEWRLRDPLAGIEACLAKSGVDRDRLDGVNREIEASLRDAVAFAESSPLPDGQTVTEHVYG